MKSAEAVGRFSLGAALKLAELERYDNAPLLHRLREREPVTWFAEQGVWLVTSKALFDELQMDPGRFVVDVPDNPQRVVLGRQMLVVDGEEHARHRGPFARVVQILRRAPAVHGRRRGSRRIFAQRDGGRERGLGFWCGRARRRVRQPVRRRRGERCPRPRAGGDRGGAPHLHHVRRGNGRLPRPRGRRARRSGPRPDGRAPGAPHRAPRARTRRLDARRSRRRRRGGVRARRRSCSPTFASSCSARSRPWNR